MNDEPNHPLLTLWWVLGVCVAAVLLCVALRGCLIPAHATLTPIGEPVFTNCVLWDSAWVSPDTLVYVQIKTLVNGDSVIAVLWNHRETGLRYLWSHWFASDFPLADFYDLLGQCKAREIGIKP